MERIDYLPLGSVVYLNNGTKKLMIVGRGLLLNNEGEVNYFDYSGVTYPEGIQGDSMAYFQHESVKKVVFTGFTDLDDEVTVDKINNFIESHPEIKRGNIGNDIKIIE